MKSPGTTTNYAKKTHSTAISQPVLLGLFCFIALGLVAGGIGFYQRQAQAIRERKFIELQSIATLKVNQISQWRQERLTDAKINSTSPFFVQGFDDWLHSPDDAKLKAQILARLQILVDQEIYQNVMLAMPSGQLLLSVDPDIGEIDQNTKNLVVQAANSPAPIFGDLFRDANDKKVYIEVAAPIYDSDPEPKAILIFRIDPEKYLFPLIQSWPVPSQSAETLLVEKDGNDAVYLNTLRFREDPPLTIRVPLTREDIPAVQAGMGRMGDLQGIDYRGIEVLAVIQPVPETQWFLEAKVDTAEILAEVNSLGGVVAAFVFLAVAMTAVLALYSFHDRQRVLYRNLYQTERALRESQEETRTTLYSIGDGVITTDSRGSVTRINPVAETLTGWSEKDALGKPLVQVFNIKNEITRKEVENPVERALREGAVVGLANHTLLIAREGTERPIADSAAPIRNPQGAINGVVLVFRDQTQERASLREHALLNYTISNSLSEIYLFDATTLHFLYINDGALRNLGYNLEQMHGMTPADLKPEFTLETFQQTIRPLVEHRESVLVFETIHQRKDGTLYPVEVHLQLFEYEQEQVFLAVINDISERRRADKELEENKARLEQAQAIAHVGNWEIDLQRQQMWASAEAFQIYGLERTSPYLPLVKAQSMVLTEDRPRLDAALDYLLEHQGNYDIEFRIRRDSDGVTRIIHSVANLETDANGAALKVCGVIQDITQIKAAEQALRESEERYRRLFENDHVVMLLLDPENGCIMDANPAACNFYGWTKDELTRLKINQINTLSSEEIQHELTLAIKEQRKIFSFRHRKKDGTISDVEVFTGPIELNGKTLLFSIVHDVSERKKAEIQVSDQLQELRRWHKAMLGREARIMELKQQVNDLLIQLNQPPRYPSIQAEAQNE